MILSTSKFVIAPFMLISIPSEGNQLAEFIERYATETCERMLPSLGLTFEERQELTRLDMELHKQIRNEPWNYGWCSDSYGEFGDPANRAAADLIEAIVKELKKSGGFTLPSFGTFTVKKTKARKGVNPRTGEPLKIKAGKTVRFKASPTLKTIV